MLTGSYLPGDSLLHRATPGAKLLVLMVATVVLVFFASPAVLAVIAALVVALYALARVPLRTALAQVWPLRWFLVLVIALQVWQSGWAAAVLAAGNLVVAVAAASLVTLTTRVSELLETLVAGLRRLSPLGVDAERVALLIALTLRAIPVVGQLARTSAEARRARGLERSVRALVTPTVVRTVRHAERVGDALVARGVDD